MKKISIESNLRGYTYTAHLFANGKLARITAGCRTWDSFGHAERHYQGLTPEGDRWRDSHLESIGRLDRLRAQRMYADRYEARCILAKLATCVGEYQGRVAASKRRRANAAHKKRRCK